MDQMNIMRCTFMTFEDGAFEKIFYLFIFREGGREVEREGEKNGSVASSMPPTRDLAHIPGMCPDLESTGNFLVCGITSNPLSHTS